MSQHDDTPRLRHMLDHAIEAVQLTSTRDRSDLDRDRLLNLALVRLIEIVGSQRIESPPRPRTHTLLFHGGRSPELATGSYMDMTTSTSTYSGTRFNSTYRL